MVKSEEEVIHDFNEIVNMTSKELEAYLETEESKTTGYTKDDGSGEAIGHESGRKIVDILKRNPDKDESKYTDEDKEHMRRVVSYCKRHLAQEEHLKSEKSPEELEKSKSTRSLKNWGHDPMKTLSNSKGDQEKSKGDTSAKPASKSKPASKAKPDSKGKPESKGKPASKGIPPSKGKPETNDKPASKKGEEEIATIDEEKVEEEKGEVDGDEKKAAGEKRAAEGGEEKKASKKAKTKREPTEGTRKPPSRGAKKA